MRLPKIYTECLRKKKLTEKWANVIIKKAEKDKKSLFKYYCNHCFNWHLTSKLKESRI